MKIICKFIFILVFLFTIETYVYAEIVPVTTCGTELNTSGTTYVLQNDLSCTGTALWILNDDIVLDLNGYKIRYGSGNEDNRYGIALPATYGRSEFENKSGTHNNIIIKNGYILQNGDGANGHGIRIRQGDHLEISNISITVSGYNADCIKAEYIKGNISIHDNMLIDQTKLITSRHQGSGAVNITGASTGNMNISHNTITDSPQYGIRIAGANETSYPIVKIHNNNIGYAAEYANPYAISLSSSIQMAEVYDNTITSTHGRGIHVQCSNSLIHNNIINVTQGAVPPEYPNYNWVHGIKIEGLSEIYPKNNKIYLNDITVNTLPDGNALGISVSLEDGQYGNEIYNNTVTANFNSTHTDRYSACIQLLGTGNTGLEIHDNIFKTQNRHVSIYWIGAKGVTFKRNVWHKLQGATNYSMLYFWNGNANNADSLFFYDSVMVDGLNNAKWHTFQDIRWSSSTGVTCEFNVGWSLFVSMKTPEPNFLTIKKADNSLYFYGSIDREDTHIEEILTYKNSRDNGLEPFPQRYNLSGDSEAVAFPPVEIDLSQPTNVTFNATDQQPQVNFLEIDSVINQPIIKSIIIQ